MINIFVATALKIILTSCNAESETKIKVNQLEEQKIATSILFYNVENLFDTIDDPIKNDEEYTPAGKLNWTAKRYNTKLKNISRVLTTEPILASIVGLAEIENRAVVENLFRTNKLKEIDYKVVTEESADERGIDVALVYDSKLFEEVRHQAIPVLFRNQPDDKTRDVLYVQLKNSQNESLHIFVNHWPSRRGGTQESEESRLTVAKLVKSKVEEIKLKDKNAKVVIMGDFNDNPTDKSIVDIIGAKSKSSKKTNFINLLADEYTAGNGTLTFKSEWNLFDQLIISKNLANAKKGLSVNPESCIILKKDFMLYKDKKSNQYFPSRTYVGEKYYGDFSDHLPVYFVLNNN
jgi:predicted extracellular nuclease